MLDIKKMLEESGLYEQFEITIDDFDTLVNLYNAKIKLDLFCLDCNEMRVFKLQNGGAYSRSFTRFVYPTVGSPAEAEARFKQNIFNEFTGFLESLNNYPFSFACAYDDSHKITFLLHVTFNEGIKLSKVGQYPSVADLTKYSLKKYRPILSDDYLSEYARALGLFSHGIGIGSFVYLRRIFEKLVLDAFAVAELEGKLTKDDFSFSDEQKHQRRMEEKIKLLRGYLPDTIIENAGIYGVLSVGVHELSEDNCLKYFPVVDTGIQIMLDDYLEKKNRKKRDDIFAKEIAKIKGEVK